MDNIEILTEKAHGFIFDLDPVLVNLGSVQIRYYGVVFALSLLIAFKFWKWQMKRGGHDDTVADNYLIYGILGTIIGARLGHCLFYEWELYAPNPLEILYFWRGGLASHGATVGIIISLWLYSVFNKFKTLEMLDRFTFSAAIGAAGVRMGNFLNSEIVGRPTDLPWGVHFLRSSVDSGAYARHPSQLYEFLMGILILIVLLLVDKYAGKEKRPLGLLFGVFMASYFLLRFCVEFFKEFQTNLADAQLLTMGQYLSIIPFALGCILIFWSLRNNVNKNDNL